MAGILDFFSPESGQRRRAALDQFGRSAEYYVPPELRQLLGFAAEMTPTATIDRAAQAGGRMMAPGRTPMQRVGDLGGMLSETAGVAAPMAVAGRAGMPVAQAVQEGLLGFSTWADDAGRKAVERANQLGPVPTMFSNPMMGTQPTMAPFDAGRGVGDNGGPPLSPLDSVDLPAHSRPEWSGAAPNRTTPYPRYTPKKTPDRMARLEARVADPNDPIREMFSNYIERGRNLGGEDWYNTEELRDWFVSELGEAAGDQQWREYMELIGTTSTGSKVPQNIRIASFYRALDPEDRSRVAQLVKDTGITPAKAAAELGVSIPNMPDNYGYGHLKQRGHAGNVVNRDAGLWDRAIPDDVTGAARTKLLQANPKVKGFGNDLLGDDTNIAADMHFMRMLAMSDAGGDFLSDQAKLSAQNYEKAAAAIGPRKIKKYAKTRMVNGKPVTEVNLKKAFKDKAIRDTSIFSDVPTAWADDPAATEYAAYENMAKRVAGEYGMTPAQFQASLWMGAGDMTGLADESQGTFMELFRRSLDKRAGERGLTRREMAEDFIRNRAVLGIGGAGVGGLGLLSAIPSQEEQY